MTNPRVLVIEKDPRLGTLFRTLLADESFDVVVLDGTDAALEAAKDLNPQIVVGDLRLAGEDLLAFQRELSALGVTCPVIMCSAWPDAERVAEELGIPFVPRPSILMNSSPSCGRHCRPNLGPTPRPASSA